MKLLMTSQAFLPACAHGGVPRASFGLARGLAELGHELRVVTTNRNGSDELDVETDRFVKYEGLDVCYCRAWKGSYLYSRSAKAILAQEFEKSDCVLHQGTTWTHLGLLSGQLTRQRGNIRQIIWPHGVFSPGALAISPVKKRMFWAMVGRGWYRRAEAVAAVSELEAEHIRAMGIAGRVEVLGTGVDMSVLVQEASRAELRRRFGQQIGGRIILSLGRLCPIKGLGYLIEAFGRIKERSNQSALVLAGPDEKGYQAKLQAQVDSLGLRENVLFTGPVEGRNKAGLLRTAHVLVMPSDSEGTGTSALEAAGCGTPVVLTHGCGVAEDLVGAGAGIAVNQDSREIAEAIRMVMSDKEMQKQMGRNGKTFVEDKYSWSAVARKTDNLIKELIGQSSE